MNGADIKAKGYVLLIQSVKSLGFPIVFCGILSYVGHEIIKEDRARITKAIEEDQEQIKADREYIRNSLETKLDASTEAMLQINQSIQNSTKVDEKVLRYLEKQEGR